MVDSFFSEKNTEKKIDARGSCTCFIHGFMAVRIHKLEHSAMTCFFGYFAVVVVAVVVNGPSE